MTKHNDQLLPCPFCGDPNPNLTHDDYVHDDLRPMPVVECTKCHTWVRAEAWNNRAQLPAGGAVPEMPATQDRRPYDDEDPDGYLEGNRDWAEANNEAVEWLADNHAAIRRALAAAPHPVSGEQKAAAPEWEDKKHLTSVIKSVVARERMRPELRTDQEVADAIYHAVAEHLPVYEDVYDQCGEMIEPYVVRPYRKDGILPGSVVDSMRLLLDYRLSSPPAAQDVAGLMELLQQVRLGEGEEARHGAGFSYWNNAVLACQIAIRDALAAHRAQQGEQS